MQHAGRYIYRAPAISVPNSYSYAIDGTLIVLVIFRLQETQVTGTVPYRAWQGQCGPMLRQPALRRLPSPRRQRHVSGRGQQAAERQESRRTRTGTIYR